MNIESPTQLKPQRGSTSPEDEAVTRETRATRGKRFLFGDDIFISYARPDSGYALALATALTERKLSCFLDQWGTEPGIELPAKLVDRLLKSTMLVLVGTEHAAGSENVMKEVLEFKKTKRPIIPITFVPESEFIKIQDNQIPENLKGTLEAASWYEEIAGIARTAESNARRKPADAEGNYKASVQVVNRIVNAQGFLSRSKRLRRTFWITLAALLTVVVAAGLTASLLIAKANEKVRDAQAQQARAEEKRVAALKAQEAADEARVLAECKTLKAQEDLTTAQDDLKEASAGLLVANQKTREEQARAATARREAERQGRIASSQELAARAVSRMESDPEASVLLAKDAYNFAPTEQAGRALRNSLLSSYVRTVVRKGDRQRSPVFDPTGRYAVGTSADGTIEVLQLETGEVVPLRPPEGVKGAPDFSPDGKYVVVNATDDRVYAAYLWEWRSELSANNPKLLRTDVAADDNAPCQCNFSYCSITAETFSSDGRYFGAASHRGVAWVWDVGSGERVAKLVAGESAISDLRFHPGDSRYVATGDNAGQVLFWDWKATEGQEGRLVIRPAGSSGSETNVAFDKHGQFLAAAINPKYPSCNPPPEPPPSVYEVLVYNFGTRQYVNLTGHVAAVNDLSFSPDGQYVLTGSDDGTARVYEWQDANQHRNPVILRHGGEVSFASFDPDGNYVVTSGDRTPRLWKPSIGREFGRSNNKSVDSPSLAVLRGHAESASASFSSDGKLILTWSADGTARIWRAPTERVKATLPKQEREVTSAALSHDARRVVTTGWSLPVRVWRAGGESREPEAELREGSDDDGYEYASFSPNGRFVIAAKNRRTGDANAQVVHYWNWTEVSGRTRPRSIAMPGGRLNGIAVSHHKDGVAYVAAASGRDTLPMSGDAAGGAAAPNAARLWALRADGTVSNPVVFPHPKPVLAADFSHDRDSRYLATASEDGIRIFDRTQPGAPPVHLTAAQQFSFTKVAFSPDGRYVAAAAHHPGFPLVWEWRTEAGRKTPVMLRSNSDLSLMSSVTSIAFSPDSKLVLTAVAGGVLRLWDRATGDDLQAIGDYPESGKDASFSRDGSYIVSPYYSTVRIYECPECGPEDRLAESVPERVSLQSFHPNGRSNRANER